jgi:hypothetical protein
MTQASEDEVGVPSQQMPILYGLSNAEYCDYLNETANGRSTDR